MNDGWLWLSILKIAAWPSPISTTPAFSPGPQMTRGPVVGRRRSHFFDDLYEQCSLHITEKMPSSVRLGVRPRMTTARMYSSVVRPCSAMTSGTVVTRCGSYWSPGKHAKCPSPLVGEGGTRRQRRREDEGCGARSADLSPAV